MICPDRLSPPSDESTFPGAGVIRCQICGQPVVEHRIGACPEWDTGMLGPITLPAESKRNWYRRRAKKRAARRNT